MQKNSVDIWFDSDKFNYICACLIAVAVVLPILFYGIPYGYDMPHHYQCALTYLEAMKTGDFYPSWTLDRNLGYGALELRMYPPISHYVLAIFALVFKSWHLATWANYTFWWIIGGIGAYLFAREFVRPQAALFASALFSLMPYRLSQLYLTFLYSELCAIAILPFCFLFLTRIFKEAEKNDKIITLNVLGFAFAYAVLVLTHLPMTVIGSISLGIYFFAQFYRRSVPFKAVCQKTVCGLAAGLAATSFFWLKVVQERSLMAKTLIYDEVHVHYEYNFLLTFLQTYDDISSEVYQTVTVVYDVILFFTLFICLPLLFLGIYSKKNRLRYSPHGIFITLAATVFLTTILSKILWDVLPILSEVQFPWRFLGVVSIFASVAAATGFESLIKYFHSEKTRYLALIVAGTVAVGCFFGINQSIRGAIYRDADELNEFVQNAGQIEGFSFWWTKYARKETFKSLEKVSAGSRRIEIKEWTPTHRTFQVSAGDGGEARAAVFFHPGWVTKVDDKITASYPTGDGALGFSLPVQAATVEIVFEESTAVKIGRYISLSAASLMIFGLIFLLSDKLTARKKF